MYSFFLKILFRRTDFRNNQLLRFIESEYYRYELIPNVSYLQLSPYDFYQENNYDYSLTDKLENEKQYGSYPYYLPIGWFRHAINLSDKYSDDNIWFGQSNIDGEWPIAYHGTNQIFQQDLLSNSTKKDDTIPVLYVTTHCNNGADIFTTPFIVSNGDQNETFRIAFQCRVKPNSFTTHNDIIQDGEAWRIVDPKAIRSYGLLLKNETVLS